jgi:hypothetical protein
MSMLTEGSPSPSEAIHRAGEQITEARPGSLCCVGCGYAVSIPAVESLPECPNCHGRSFRRVSLFDARPTVDVAALANVESTEWLTEARAEIDRAGHYLAFDEGGGDYAVVRLEPGWTRIGRSRAADVQLDDATVSRRHALIVLTESGELRALDDRSLNGLFVNGERVDWAPLADGDELEIGRFRLYLLEA